MQALVRLRERGCAAEEYAGDVADLLGDTDAVVRPAPPRPTTSAGEDWAGGVRCNVVHSTRPWYITK